MSPHRPLPLRVQAELERLAPEARRVLLAVSGGSDSVALLRAVVAAGAPSPVVAHLDHGLRPESADDAAWVRALCRDLGVACVTDRVPIAEVAARRRGNVEAVGRTVRYAFLARAAREHGCDAVATAHTRSDQAETVLMQLLRGAAHPSGVAPRLGHVVRPLLAFSREDLRGWLDGLGQAWREDPGNLDVARERAWLRSQVLPRLEARRPGAQARLARFGHLQRDQASFLAGEARRRFGERGPVARAALASAPRALQREVLVQRVREAGGDVDRSHLGALLDALARGETTRRDLPGAVRVRLLRDRVDVVPCGHGEAGPAPRVVDRPDDLPPGLPASLLDAGPWTQRGPEPGDRIRLDGGRRAVADVLAEAGVPREERASVRVLARDGEVAWIEDVAVAAGLDAEAADPDLRWMRRALALADEAAADGEAPIGAVVVRDGVVLGEGRNRREADGDPTAHAELLAMRAAAERDGDWRLSGATLYVTLEPCPMCAGATIETRLARVVWGAPNRREGAFGSVVDLTAGPFARVPEVRGGVAAGDAARRLERFFAGRRSGGPRG